MAAFTAESLVGRKRRVLVFGETGSGKSTLVTGLSRCLDKKRHPYNAGP